MKSALIILLSVILWIAGTLNASAQSQLLPIEKGGVAEDVQLIYPDNYGDTSNVVWTACMNTGIYRSTWDGSIGNPWSDWDQYLPAKKCFGVDAIEIGGTEYVLCASQGLGLWYGADATPSTFNPNWIRPNPNFYPENWEHAGTHDAAFYWGTGVSPEQKFYVILTSGAVNAGVYRWTGTSPNYFDVVDEENQPPLPRHYSHFYRDLNDRAKLYVILNPKYDENGQLEEEGGLYKISGNYGSESFDDVTPVGTEEVVSFNQWKDEHGVVTYYILVKIENGGDNPYRVYVDEDLDGELDWNLTSIYTPTGNLGLNREELYRYNNGAGVIGRPDGENHHLWLTNSTYGVWYVHAPDPGSPVQINGLDANGVPALKRWAVRAFTMDTPEHFQQGENMRLFFGSHQAGVWYLKFSR